jgi:hypothetical protein
MGIVTARGSVDGGGGPEFVGGYPPCIKGVGNAGGYETGLDGVGCTERYGDDGACADALLKVW